MALEHFDSIEAPGSPIQQPNLSPYSHDLNYLPTYPDPIHPESSMVEVFLADITKERRSRMQQIPYTTSFDSPYRKSMDLNFNTLNVLAKYAAKKIEDTFPMNQVILAYPIPNGGVYAGILIQAHCRKPILLQEQTGNSNEHTDCYIDDLIDSGATKQKYNGRPFFALLDKNEDPRFKNIWVSFPWERMKKEEGPEDNVRRLLQYIGECPTREGLLETPSRVVRSYKELFSGYKEDVSKIFKVFEDGACDEMVLLKNIEVSSMCEHHMLPFIGTAHIAYIPDKKIIGISKLARLLEVYARRLQVQERLTTQITDALDKHLDPKGSACVIEAKHLCMACRGVRKQNSIMVTSSLTKVFRKPEVRMEFFNLIKE